MGELIVNGIKWAFIIGISITFMVAINTLINILSSIVLGNVVGEVLGVVSNCLPFSASAVVSSLLTTMSAVFAFLIAKKIYDLTGAHIKV